MKLTLPVPPSNNNFKRIVVIKGQGRLVLTGEAKKYKADAEKTATDAGCKPIDGPCAVHVAVYRPRRAGDLDNYLKVMLDSLTGIAYHDDAQIVSIQATRHEDKANPRVEVEILPISEEN